MGFVFVYMRLDWAQSTVEGCDPCVGLGEGGPWIVFGSTTGGELKTGVRILVSRGSMMWRVLCFFDRPLDLSVNYV